MWILQQEYWSGLPCPPPGDLPKPGIQPRSPALQRNSLPSEPPGKPLDTEQCAKSLQSCPTPCDPVDYRPPGSSVQAKVLEQVAIPFSRGSSLSRDQTCVSYVSCIGRQVLYHQCHLGSARTMGSWGLIPRVRQGCPEASQSRRDKELGLEGSV